MDHIPPLYDMLKKQHPGRITTCTRKGDLAPLFEPLGIPLDAQTARQLVEYAKRKEAEKLTPPYLLSDHLCYVYEGDLSQFARTVGVTEQQVEQLIYDGCYWHGGVVLRPVDLFDNSLTDFVTDRIVFGKGKALRTELWAEYCLWTQGRKETPLQRIDFLRTISNELANRGYPQTQSVRMGKKVGVGYKNLSLRFS